MEFVQPEEALAVLKHLGMTPETDGDCVFLRLSGDPCVHIHFATAASEAIPHGGAEKIEVSDERISELVEEVIHKLHLRDVLLIPVGVWRKVFDAVAFALAENEDWQAIDATATVELNTRDPLICGPEDFHTMTAPIAALFENGETADQGLMITTAAAPVLVEVVPDGAVRVCAGSQVLADEILQTVSG